MKAAANAAPDPADKDGKLYAVDVTPVRKLKRPVKLSEIKADKAFADFALVRMSRLSVMPVTDEQWAADRGDEQGVVVPAGLKAAYSFPPAA